MSLLSFPDGFLWGAATSAHQVEGGNQLNDWWRFEQLADVVRGGDRSGEACRHWERFDEDFALAAGDHHTAHRLSLEWSRLEPEPGRFDAAAIAHYHAVFASLRRHHLTPIVTLHHFTNPLWVADRGGWENRVTLDDFDRFVQFCAREFGAEVDWWCTVNEPEVYAFRSYSEGVWPPGRRDDGAALEVIANLLEAHGRAYHILHAEDRIDADGDGRAVRVGFAKHYPILEPLRPWFPLDVLRAWFENRVFNDAVLEAPRSGRIRLSIPGARSVSRQVPALAGALDWLGLNYYTRWKVNSLGPVAHVAAPGATVNDLGWEHHPAGIEQVLRRIAIDRTPILITEHGVADAEDRLRPRAIVETLRYVHRAIEAGVPVVGYLHWSLLDNFEWADGYFGRFGLYGVGFGDPARPRVRRESAAVLSRIAQANALEA
ncbi:MAG: glycoside hydrolase family 1 protein [Candidatus Eisenbacteria bacterium]|uniref:Glycoside hydrolase family 1 protein n=1 Tax=Eiseniibacteriota bacterium TaxID=2212470 RepID=A0A849SIE7_UNCEI|nr:glycoside hydrolase family 1 protein [Candidatus Eisenbacteria bacterium]